MTVTTQATSSKSRLYTGYALTTLFTLFMLMDAAMKFTHAAPVIAANNELGFPLALVPSIGILALVLLALYLIPATSVLAAVLFTGYLGGAIALHLRIDHPYLAYTLFPTYIALFLWGGIWLRDASLRQLFPITETPFTPPSSKAQLRTGYVLSGIGALLIVFTAVMKFVYVPPAGAPELFPKHHIHHLGFIEFICIALYLIPRTSVTGSVLLTAYLGGATCINLRSGDSLGTSLVPVFISLILWAGLWLRDTRLRTQLPLRTR